MFAHLLKFTLTHILPIFHIQFESDFIFSSSSFRTVPTHPSCPLSSGKDGPIYAGALSELHDRVDHSYAHVAARQILSGGMNCSVWSERMWKGWPPWSACADWAPDAVAIICLHVLWRVNSTVTLQPFFFFCFCVVLHNMWTIWISKECVSVINLSLNLANV